MPPGAHLHIHNAGPQLYQKTKVVHIMFYDNILNRNLNVLVVTMRMLTVIRTAYSRLHFIYCLNKQLPPEHNGDVFGANFLEKSRALCMKDAPKSQRNKNTEVFDSQIIILIKSA